MVPPSAKSACTKLQPQETILHLIATLIFHWDFKEKETVCKTVQNQALFFFFPASSPFIIIVIITIIVVNIISDNISHRRQTAREQILKETHSLNLLAKTGISYKHSPRDTMRKLHMSTSFWGNTFQWRLQCPYLQFALFQCLKVHSAVRGFSSRRHWKPISVQTWLKCWIL